MKRKVFYYIYFILIIALCSCLSVCSKQYDDYQPISFIPNQVRNPSILQEALRANGIDELRKILDKKILAIRRINKNREIRLCEDQTGCYAEIVINGETEEILPLKLPNGLILDGFLNTEIKENLDSYILVKNIHNAVLVPRLNKLLGGNRRIVRKFEIALELDDLETVRELLRDYPKLANLEMYQVLNDIPIIYVIKENRYDMLRLLIENGAGIAIDDYRKYRLHFYAIQTRNIDMVRTVVSYLDNINHELEQDDLKVLFENGDIRIIRYLIDELELDLSLPKFSGLLEAAARHSQLRLIRYLIRRSNRLEWNIVDNMMINFYDTRGDFLDKSEFFETVFNNPDVVLVLKHELIRELRIMQAHYMLESVHGLEGSFEDKLLAIENSVLSADQETIDELKNRLVFEYTEILIQTGRMFLAREFVNIALNLLANTYHDMNIFHISVSVNPILCLVLDKLVWSLGIHSEALTQELRKFYDSNLFPENLRKYLSWRFIQREERIEFAVKLNEAREKQYFTDLVVVTKSEYEYSTDELRQPVANRNDLVVISSDLVDEARAIAKRAKRGDIEAVRAFLSANTYENILRLFEAVIHDRCENEEERLKRKEVIKYLVVKYGISSLFNLEVNADGSTKLRFWRLKKDIPSKNVRLWKKYICTLFTIKERENAMHKIAFNSVLLKSGLNYEEREVLELIDISKDRTAYFNRFWSLVIKFREYYAHFRDKTNNQKIDELVIIIDEVSSLTGRSFNHILYMITKEFQEIDDYFVKIMSNDLVVKRVRKNGESILIFEILKNGWILHIGDREANVSRIPEATLKIRDFYYQEMNKHKLRKFNIVEFAIYISQYLRPKQLFAFSGLLRDNGFEALMGKQRFVLCSA